MEECFDVVDENGVYTGQVASRDECHARGLRHNAVVIFIVDPKAPRVLLQKRADTRKMWPGLWDVSSGGHVSAGELIYQAALRECREELGLDLVPADINYIGGCLSRNLRDNIDDRHINNYFVAELSVDENKLRIDHSEVQCVAWFTVDELAAEMAKRGDNSCRITDKQGCWEAILRYFELRNQPTPK